MILRDRPFERKLRKQIRHKINENGQMRLFKEHAYRETYVDINFFLGMLVPAAIMVFFLAQIANQENILMTFHFGLLIYTLWAIYHLVNKFTAKDEMTFVLGHWAISSRQYFKLITQKTIVTVATHIFLMIFIFSVYFSVIFEKSLDDFLTFQLYVFFQIFVSLSCIFAGAYWFHKFPFFKTGAGLIGIFFIIVCLPESYFKSLMPIFYLFTSITSLGTNLLFNAVYIDQSIPAYIFILSALLMLTIFIMLYRLVSNNYHITFACYDDFSADEFYDEIDEYNIKINESSKDMIESDDNLTTIIKKGLTDSHNFEHRGWLDRFVLSKISRREYNIIHFLTMGQLNLTSNTTRTFILHLIILGLLGCFSMSGIQWLTGLLFLISLITLPLTGGDWNGFDIDFLSGDEYLVTGDAPLIAFFPIAYDELLGVTLKINLFKTLLWFISGFFVIAMVYYKQTASIKNSLLFATYIMTVIFSLIPVMTTQTMLKVKLNRTYWVTNMINLIFIIEILILAGAVVFVCFYNVLLVNVMVVFSIVILATVMFWLNRTLYKRLKLDFIR